MAWEDNRSKGVREVSREERLAWLRKQIAEMECKNPNTPTLKQRIQPRIRRNGKWVE